MRYIVVSVRDRAAECFGQPQYVPAVGHALRGFKDQVNDPKSGVLFEHPDDFELYELGSFDDNSGLFETGSPRLIAVGKDLKIQAEMPEFDLPKGVRRVS